MCMELEESESKSFLVIKACANCAIIFKHKDVVQIQLSMQLRLVFSRIKINTHTDYW